MQQTSTLVLSTVPKHTQNKQQAENLVDDYSPSDHLINNILNFSKSLDVKKSKLIGFTEVVCS